MLSALLSTIACRIETSTCRNIELPNNESASNVFCPVIPPGISSGRMLTVNLPNRVAIYALRLAKGFPASPPYPRIFMPMLSKNFRLLLIL